MSSPALLTATDAATLRLDELPAPTPAGIISHNLLQAPGLRVTHFAFAAGQELSSHRSPRRALVQILSGTCEFFFADAWHRLEAGALLHLPPDHPHAVRAGDTPFTMMLMLDDAPVAHDPRQA
jgi:quercetin dioxygenase-like cupin family protein